MTPTPTPGADDERVIALVARHGWNATAFQTLKSGCTFFFDGDDACVAYVDTGTAWVAAGAPLAPAERIRDVTRAFVDAAARAGRRSCFFATEPRFMELVGDTVASIAIGEQPAWDPRRWPDLVRGHRSLREQLRRARAKGVVVRRVILDQEGAELRASLEQLSRRWLATRGMASMTFLVRLDPFALGARQALFVAEREGAAVAFAAALPVPARGGWFIEALVRDPRAPNGAGELLVDAVMRWAADDGATWLTLGLAPLAGDVSTPLRAARRGGRLLYDFEGLRAYKAKLRPHAWTSIHLSFPSGRSAPLAVVDALRAFTGDGLLRFAWRSFVRGPSAVIRALAALLVPWTVLIALAPTAHWFGLPAVQWSWVIFDVALTAGIFAWLKRPAARLLTALAVAVSLDAVLTALQAAVWNVHVARAPLDWVVIVIACAGPLAAAVALWGARRRMRAAA